MAILNINFDDAVTIGKSSSGYEIKLASCPNFLAGMGGAISIYRRWPWGSCIVIHDLVKQGLTDDELKFIVEHEDSHLALRHLEDLDGKVLSSLEKEMEADARALSTSRISRPIAASALGRILPIARKGIIAHSKRQPFTVRNVAHSLLRIIAVNALVMITRTGIKKRVTTILDEA